MRLKKKRIDRRINIKKEGKSVEKVKTIGEIEEIRTKKVQKRGAFKEKIYLEGVQELEL